MKKILGRIIFWILGWKVNQDVPIEASRCVMTAAPHTSNWDFFFVIVAFWILDIPLKVAIKDDWTKFPFNLIVKPLGGLGINRKPKKERTQSTSQVEQMAIFFSKMDKIALVIAPEGTRRLRDTWKMGFYHVAKIANVPIAFGYLDYKNKVAGVGPNVIHVSDSIEHDMAIMMDFYDGIEGCNPDQFILDKRYYRKQN